MSSRRDFIKKIAWGLPASYALPSYLISCQKEDSLFSKSAYSGRVIVIGAGVAGLHATLILKKHGVNARLYEADRRVGGRIKTQVLGAAGDVASSSDLLVHSPVEVGAEFVYGQHNSLYDLLRNFTHSIEELPKTEQYFVNSRLFDTPTLEASAVYQQYAQIKAELLNYVGQDRTIDDYVIDRRQREEQQLELSSQISIVRQNYEQIFAILNATLSSEYGILANDLAIHEYQRKTKIRSQEAGIYRLSEDPFEHAIRALYQESTIDIAYRQKVTAIDYSESEIALSVEGSKTPIMADKVIITVPIDVLRGIRFTPDLSEEKQQALDNIKMGGAVKVFLRFTQRFWSEDLGKLFIPYPYSFLVPYPSTEHHILTLYSYGSESEGLTRLGADALTLTLELLDNVFGQKIATNNLRDFRIFHWNKELSESEFIPGAYSYVEEGFLEARAQLAAPIENKIFFAGEATHTHGQASSVQGALETGVRAAHELLKNA